MDSTLGNVLQPMVKLPVLPRVAPFGSFFTMSLTLSKIRSVGRKMRQKLKLWATLIKWQLPYFKTISQPLASGTLGSSTSGSYHLEILECERTLRVSSTFGMVLRISSQDELTNGPQSGSVVLRWVILQKEDTAQTEVPMGDFVVGSWTRPPRGKSVLIPVTAPVGLNGVYDVAIEVDLRDETGKSLGTNGSLPRIFRKVKGQNAANASADFDYVDIYAKVDLEKDYWTVVGPATREAYEELGRGKAKQLLDFGMKPDAKVLDVGCGTGQLAEPLCNILSPKGAYYGTDLGAEAIAFCKKKFRLPNFHFLTNTMTGLPLKGILFDAIYLGSVFTHMYPKDIHAMLGELRRLMADTGFILVDAFVSPDVKDYVGSISMIHLNEANLHKSFQENGFTFEEAGVIPWNEHCRRVIFKLTASEISKKAEWKGPKSLSGVRESRSAKL